ncbi:methylase involved in ubiquinone/menaquinone biosynthesis [Bernardetia litoralis DSM 6794]|uniref:Methylase involved in ubiquinone/menaquinone biosynthesis n=1 Tax=Bernardetia litoralis (strain ATCC 23117 / DSM 6794 / NBRC 15988 / NCIMB 1366 / Fx l1 / Sio-4) TaxID=880071 RepID=I4AHU1_BERLS|nr:methyltransferase [Bernardetia litoralis]AFM03526.1 methylase involved in ubiquinone/menaquinone biosynthesis [Bernardetia litoralis DSM 6794]
MKNISNKKPPTQIREIMMQMVFSRCLSIAAELGIADLVAHQPKSTLELSQKLNINEDALYRLIRVLMIQGVFELDKNRVVSNNDVSFYLMEEVEGSQRSFARMQGSPWMWKIFNNLEDSITTGNSASKKAIGFENLFEYFKKENPKDGKVFSQSMSSFSYAFDEPLVSAYDFSKYKNVIDLGGAEGRLLKVIKKHYPAIQPILFDLPHAIEQAKQNDTNGVLECIEGDFFNSIPADIDCYVIKYVLHNWNDEDCIKILKKCREAISANGRLLIMDMVIKEDEPQVFEKSLDIVMLLLLGSKERTKEEFENILTKAGFKLNTVFPTKSPLSIIEAIPV